MPRRFRCPRCEAFALEPVLQAHVAARCAVCAFETNDLLNLVPVQLVAMGTAIWGTGRAVAWRLALACALIGGSIYLLMRGL